tara:strand:- start:306 stop:815 length:510 start_codon:yes stop_codon:yes gene_type:complete
MKTNVPAPKSGRAWTGKEEDILAEMVDAEFSDAEIGAELGRSPKSIQVRKCRIRARAGKCAAHNKAVDVAIDGLVLKKAKTMTEEELEFIRKHEQQWTDFRKGNMGEGKTSGLLHAEQFMSDEDSEISPENNKNTSPGYTTLRISHTYFYACVYVVALSLAFYLGSIYQ